jgi:hypothetical protein
LEALPNATQEDLDSILLIKNELKRSEVLGRSRGSLDNMLAALQAEDSQRKYLFLLLSSLHLTQATLGLRTHPATEAVQASRYAQA